MRRAPTAIETEAGSHCVGAWWVGGGESRGETQGEGSGGEDEVLRPEARIPIRRFRPGGPCTAVSH